MTTTGVLLSRLNKYFWIIVSFPKNTLYDVRNIWTFPKKNLPWWCSSWHFFVQVIQNHFLVLFQQFVTEFSQNFQKRQIWWGTSWISWIFQWIDCHQDSFLMQSSDGFTIFQSIKTKRECESFGQFFQAEMTRLIWRKNSQNDLQSSNPCLKSSNPCLKSSNPCLKSSNQC